MKPAETFIRYTSTTKWLLDMAQITIAATKTDLETANKINSVDFTHIEAYSKCYAIFKILVYYINCLTDTRNMSWTARRTLRTIWDNKLSVNPIQDDHKNNLHKNGCQIYRSQIVKFIEIELSWIVTGSHVQYLHWASLLVAWVCAQLYFKIATKTTATLSFLSIWQRKSKTGAWKAACYMRFKKCWAF